MRRLLRQLRRYRLRKTDRRIIVFFFCITFVMLFGSWIAEALLRKFCFTFSQTDFVLRILSENFALVTLYVIFVSYLFLLLYYFYFRKGWAWSWLETIRDILTGIFSTLSGISAGMAMGFLPAAIAGDVRWSTFLTLLFSVIGLLIMLLTFIVMMPSIERHDLEVPSQGNRVRR